eukprot:NODE_3245_length_1252_cov_119.137290_g3081_i0.p1 GENE.NODE_3245_length_1252_cov_119.137290_g3081_i0~~NODE_3245_length_1252_cov_119.137290_g3081_i0.p1  ORF type:complete len:343 (+),score=44.21 NODE_3245_length_1252_cov_119.137290_g3081_i0:58-1086(+)
MGVSGYMGTLVAAAFWGSNFVVTKRFDMGNGMAFQLHLCTGILLVGIMTLFLAPGDVATDFRTIFAIEGLLGGTMWTVGNLTTVPIVRSIGLGLGLSIWGGTSMVVGFIAGVIGITIKADVLSRPALGIVGIILGVAMLIVFSFIKPASQQQVDKDQDQDQEALNPIIDKNHERPSLANPPRLAGIAMALMAGVLYGLQFIPFQYWRENRTQPTNMSAIRWQATFFFSQFTGIFMSSLLAYMIYAVVQYSENAKPQQLEQDALVPSVISGIMWATASMGSMIGVADLGLAIAFPASSNGAFIVNALISLLVYREIQGKRNLALFGIGALLNITSTVCVALSH